MKNPIVDRVMDRIASHSGCISKGMLAADLKLREVVVERHVQALIKAGRVEIAWDGKALCVTDQEAEDRASDAAFRASLRSLGK